MSTVNIHLHDKQGRHYGDICAPVVGYYLARIHRRGCHKYEVIGKYQSESEAIEAIGVAFAHDRRWPKINRGDVLMAEKEPSYYDPSPVCEMEIRNL